MHPTQDTGLEGLPGQALANTQWGDPVCRIQEAGGALEAPTSTHPLRAAPDAVPVCNSDERAAIQAVLAGFAAPEWHPHGYQERGIEWLTSRISGALFLAPGMGKTSITLAAILKLKQMGYAKRILILAPLTVCVTTWISEPKKWLQFQGLKIGLAHGPNKQRVLEDPQYDIVVMNYDGLAWAAPVLAKGHTFGALVCDEITKLKHASSKRFKLLKPLLPSFTFRWGLTASPTANGLMDLFGQVFVLDSGQRLGRYITHFRAKYFHQEPWDQYRYFITPEKADLLTAQLTDLAMYMDPKDYLVLPGLLDVVRPVKLKGMLEYKFLRDEFILKMQDTTITAVNAGVLTNKLRQFAGGALYTEDRECTEVGTDKIDALVELVEELNGEPLIVAYEFNHEAERLLKIFPTAKAIRGGMSTKAVQDIVASWNAGGIPVLLIQPQAGAHGINLQEGGSAICWFSLTYNMENYQQLIARIYRQGQKALVRNYLLVAEGTIDEALVKILADKDATQESVFQALKAYVALGK